MKLQAALLCDAAVVHDTVMSMLDAGRTQVVGVDLPLPLDVRLALMVNCEEAERDVAHDVRIEVADATTGAVVGTYRRPFSVLPLEAPGVVNVPLVADLSVIALPTVGLYDITVAIDDQTLAELAVQALCGG